MRARALVRGWDVMLATTRDEAVPLLGRDGEQRVLTSMLDEVAIRGAALVLHGEPGVGKFGYCPTRSRGGGTGHDSAHYGWCAVGSSLPFAGLHQLLRPVRGRAVELPAVQRSALDAAFGLTLEPAPEHFRIAMAALDLVSDVATDAPLLLVAEDAQWLDRPTWTCLPLLLGESNPTRSSCSLPPRWLSVGA